MKLIEILSEENICVNLKGSSKLEVIHELIALLEKSNCVENHEAIFDAVMAREAIMTTGVGRGVAIPHCKIENCNQFSLSLGFHKKGFDYQSIDNLPTRIIFLLVGPENNPGMHIRLLSRISRLISREGVKEELIKCSSASEAYQILQNEEKKYFEIVS